MNNEAEVNSEMRFCHATDGGFSSHTLVGDFLLSLRKLRVLGVSEVNLVQKELTAETQRSQRRRRVLFSTGSLGLACL